MLRLALLTTYHWLKRDPISALWVLPLKFLTTSLAILLNHIKYTSWTQEVYRDERIHKCHQCAMFNAKLQSCGTPGEFDSFGRPIGCWCYMPAAARVVDKRCWRDARNIPGGWGEK